MKIQRFYEKQSRQNKLDQRQYPWIFIFLKYTITKTSYLIIRKFTVVEKEGDRAVGFL